MRQGCATAAPKRVLRGSNGRRAPLGGVTATPSASHGPTVCGDRCGGSAAWLGVSRRPTAGGDPGGLTSVPSGVPHTLPARRKPRWIMVAPGGGWRGPMARRALCDGTAAPLGVRHRSVARRTLSVGRAGVAALPWFLAGAASARSRSGPAMGRAELSAPGARTLFPSPLDLTEKSIGCVPGGTAPWCADASVSRWPGHFGPAARQYAGTRHAAVSEETGERAVRRLVGA